MSLYSVVRCSTFGLFSGLLLAALSFSQSWAMHAQVQCQACHPLKPDDKEMVAKELRAPVNTLCFACHDGQQDVSGLHPPYIINGRQELAGGSFTATLDFDGTGHNMLKIDATLGLTPPGGLTRTEFDCLSCHDPHPNGNFRNLKTLINGRPTPVRAESDEYFEKNLYISGINDFCSSCHVKFSSPSPSAGAGVRRRHPVGISLYGAQHVDFHRWEKMTDKITLAEFPSGNPNNPYSAQVFCLSCHYAHGGPYRNALRWDYARNVRGCLECHSF